MDPHKAPAAAKSRYRAQGSRANEGALQAAFRNVQSRASRKLELAKEVLRLLRHGGKLHVAEYDKPATGGERRILRLAAYISGPAAVEPHIDGSWTALLAK